MQTQKKIDGLCGFLRREDTARFLGVSLRTLAEWQTERRIPYAKMSHRVCLFKITDLEKAIERLTIKAGERGAA